MIGLLGELAPEPSEGGGAARARPPPKGGGGSCASCKRRMAAVAIRLEGSLGGSDAAEELPSAKTRGMVLRALSSLAFGHAGNKARIAEGGFNMYMY